MSYRLSFPQGYDPHMRKEEMVTLSRLSSQQNAIPRANGSPSTMQTIDHKASQPRRRHFVFADPVAFRYLEEDPATVVIERRGKIQGYELYLVEQWACSRVHPTFVITTFTGDPNHVVMVGVLGVPADEETWSPRLRTYFKAISQYHARPKDTTFGMLMVTNLSSFPSALTVIPVPDGDVKKHREDFIVNENLKRLGCSGRSGMSLATPAAATQAKFQQLYKTSEKIPLYGSVIELVKLCQVALMVFGKLEQEYADGLLCDVTEKAVNDWWTEIGSEYYNIEPTDGILGPTTVSALLGLLMGARNRLNYIGAPVAKDPFDVSSLKRGIAHFQKSQKLERNRRLDRHTLNRLHHVTAKAAAGEGWAVPKAVKSTVAELSGKGGEMVMGMVGRDKAGIGDIETLDIDRLVSLVHGERSKWLWYGKPRKNVYAEQFGKSDPNSGVLSFTRDDQGGYMWSHSRTESAAIDDESDRRQQAESPQPVYRNQPPSSAVSMVESPFEKDPQLRKNVFKSVAGKMGDARSGFSSRVKEAVGLRGHSSKHSRDEGMDGYFSPNGSTGLTSSAEAPSSPGGGGLTGRAFTWKDTPEQYMNGVPRRKNAPAPRPVSAVVGQDSDSPHSEPRSSMPNIPTLSVEDQKIAETDARWAEQVREIQRTVLANDASVAGSAYGDDLEGPLLEASRDPNSFEILLRRRHSCPAGIASKPTPRNEAWWPRQMSFTDAEEAILDWEPVDYNDEDDIDESDTWAALQKQKCIAGSLRNLYEKIVDIQDEIGPWVERKVVDISKLDEQAAGDQEELQALFYQLTDQHQAVKQNAQDILGAQRTEAMEAVKDVEVLAAKLEYEINALISKVQDVEDGVSQFERQVIDLETRADELEAHLKTESWAHWLVRSLTGIGTGANITAPRPAQGQPPPQQ